MRKYRFYKKIAFFLLFLISYEIMYPVIAVALTTGPSQPEAMKFSPIGADNMVDIFSGDFNYNIPLIEIGGYPLNLTYDSNINMDDEASWVGLGWNLTPGNISRSLRGIPDDFNKEVISQEFSTKDNVTIGVSGSVGLELAGVGVDKAAKKAVKKLLNSVKKNGGSLEAGINLYYNTYTGWGYGSSISAATAISKVSGGISFSTDTKKGSTLSPTLGYGSSTQNKSTFKSSISISGGLNSRQGLEAVTLSAKAGVGVLSKDKSKYAAIGLGHSTSFDFGYPSYMPSINFPMLNESYSGSVSFGLDLAPAYANVNLQGFYSSQKLISNEIKKPAYGYLNLHNSNGADDALLDFNREKDGPINNYSTNLAIPYGTHDLFVINTHGIGGQFRAYRNDVGHFYDPVKSDKSQNVNGGLEIGPGGIAHLGGNIYGGTGYSKAGKWQSNNLMVSATPFISTTSELDFEPSFFRMEGESYIENNDQFKNEIGEEATEIKLINHGPDVMATSTFINDNHNKVYNSTGSTYKKTKRTYRKNVISYLTGIDATNYALEKEINSYDYPTASISINVCNNTPDSSYRDRTKDLISEFNINDTEGKRFIYGIPTLNVLQRDVTFSVADKLPNSKKITYDNNDNSINNDKGRENYFQAQNTPPYAYSWLLTAIVSPDYVDITGDGISDDDFGNAIKFKYSRTSDEYRWRTPYELRSANLQEGMQDDPKDDKASYVYGKKEVWYSHSIESKDMYLQFYTSRREDALGVKGEDGGKDTSQRLMKLDSIKLFTKAEIKENPNNPTPIKTVHFIYNYELCKDVPNNSNIPIYDENGINVNLNKGKLTLKKVYFTYGKNKRGKTNAYVFNYNNILPYQFMQTDKWGIHQNNPTSYPLNNEYPYANQNKILRDQYVAAWSINKITLPSGADIEVSYESDDYAYVQENQATQMYFIKGFTDKLENSMDNLLYKNSGKTSKNILFFNKPPGVNNSVDLSHLIPRKPDGKYESIFFKCKVDVNKDDKDEWVEGFFDIEDYGIHSNGYAYIKIKNLENFDENKSLNPITLAALQVLRFNLPGKAFPGSDPATNGNAEVIFAAFGSKLKGVLSLILGFTKESLLYGKGKEVNVQNKSWIRLYNPIDRAYAKLGGTHRVKEIKIKDNWQTMASGENSATFGQKYEYTTTSNGKLISSGVAAWEPAIGEEDNPYYLPVAIEEKVKLAPNKIYYNTKPFGVSFYPPPTIGYSEVKVSPIEDIKYNRTSTGYTIHKFFTAKEFPVFNSATHLKNDINFIEKKSSPFGNLLNLKTFHNLFASQGYLVALNDMHGKVKSVEVFNANKSLISYQKYFYKADNQLTSTKTLKNEVDVVDKDWNITKDTLGVEQDIWLDFREFESENTLAGAAVNTETLLAFGITVPFIWPKKNNHKEKFKSVVTTKLVKTKGILYKTEVMENGSVINTENLLWDKKTGEVLLTRTNNEFDNFIYSLNFPAHWYYDGMGPAYENIDLKLTKIKITNGELSNTSYNNFLHEGDELLKSNIYYPSSSELLRYYVVKTPGIKIINKDGKLVDDFNDADYRVIRSGKRNHQVLPVGTITLLEDPRTNNNTLVIDQSKKIINASVVEYNQKGKTACNNYPDREIIRYSNVLSDTTIKNFIVAAIDSGLIWATEKDRIKLKDILPGIEDINGIPIGDYQFYATSERDKYSNNGDPVTIQPTTITGIIKGYGARMGPYRVWLGIATPNVIELNSVVNYMEFWRYLDTIGTINSINHISSNHMSFSSTTPDDMITLNYEVLISSYSEALPICRQDTLTIFNPFERGLLGIWRPEKNFTYYTDRTPNNLGSSSNVRSDGAYSDFTSFWKPAGQKDVSNNWIWKSEITLYDSKGNEVENKNALNQYSSALFGYNNSMATAVAGNAEYVEIANDNFEDYSYATSCIVLCKNDHWSVRDALNDSTIFIDTLQSHSGRKSLRIEPNSTALVTRDIRDYTGVTYSIDSNRYKLETGGCYPKFSPKKDSIYLFSAWVKENQVPSTGTYLDNSVVVKFNGSGTFFNIYSKGPIIEGWQRYEGKFTVPDVATDIIIELKSLDNVVYFDDIRIHPINSNMKSYVYDPRTLRLMAILDENNYATFYEYDDEGNLIRTKRETERGIKTITENRNYLKINN